MSGCAGLRFGLHRVPDSSNLGSTVLSHPATFALRGVHQVFSAKQLEGVLLPTGLLSALLLPGVGQHDPSGAVVVDSCDKSLSGGGGQKPAGRLPRKLIERRPIDQDRFDQGAILRAAGGCAVS